MRIKKRKSFSLIKQFIIEKMTEKRKQKQKETYKIKVKSIIFHSLYFDFTPVKFVSKSCTCTMSFYDLFEGLYGSHHLLRSESTKDHDISQMS